MCGEILLAAETETVGKKYKGQYSSVELTETCPCPRGQITAQKVQLASTVNERGAGGGGK